MRTGSAGQTGRPPETATVTVTFKFHIPLEPRCEPATANGGREAYLNCKSKAQKYLAKQTEREMQREPRGWEGLRGVEWENADFVSSYAAVPLKVPLKLQPKLEPICRAKKGPHSEVPWLAASTSPSP